MVKPQLILSAALVCCAALAVRAQPVPPAGGSRGRSTHPVSLILRADKKSYGEKDPIKLTLTAKCPAKTPVKLTFSSGMKYDFEIRKGKAPSGEKVWQWSRGHMFTEMVTNTTLDPAKPLSFSETFAPGEQGADGKPVPQLEPGVYRATGILTISGRAPRPMASTTFTVR